MKIKSLLVIIIVAVMVANFSSCNAFENLTKSSVKFILHSLVGLDSSDTETDVVLSDVIDDTGGVTNDNATASFSAVGLDPFATDFTSYQNVIIDQIDIVYTRGDLPNAVQGRDVPFAFSQKCHLLVETGSVALSSLTFIVVPHFAKAESPLVDLVNLGQEFVLKMEAQITFYGKDVEGNRLDPVIGTISIWFANYSTTN
ncbi:MAG: hypothetical protein GY940_23605 [bacterium]|nr:hypothetical protein [bacterium]